MRHEKAVEVSILLSCRPSGLPGTADMPPSRLRRFGEPRRSSRVCHASGGGKVRTTTGEEPLSLLAQLGALDAWETPLVDRNCIIPAFGLDRLRDDVQSEPTTWRDRFSTREEGTMRRSVGAVLLAGHLTVGGAAAQTVSATMGAVDGRVTDHTNAVLPGVTVTISGPAMMGTRVVATNEEGAYRVAAVPPGDYSIVFTL